MELINSLPIMERIKLHDLFKGGKLHHQTWKST